MLSNQLVSAVMSHHDLPADESLDVEKQAHSVIVLIEEIAVGESVQQYTSIDTVLSNCNLCW